MRAPEAACTRERERAEISTREAVVDHRYLLGATGVTTTRLVPAGKARFGEEYIDVLSEGDLIDRGTSVVVVEARGSRVVVRPADDET